MILPRYKATSLHANNIHKEVLQAVRARVIKERVSAATSGCKISRCFMMLQVLCVSTFPRSSSSHTQGNHFYLCKDNVNISVLAWYHPVVLWMRGKRGKDVRLQRRGLVREMYSSTSELSIPIAIKILAVREKQPEKN